MTGPDILGLVGVGMIVVTYFLSQMGRMAVDDPRYPASNGVGALLILVSLYFSFNLASFVIEVIWLAISIMGLWRALKKRP